jgi:hypothetical protein
LAAARHRFQLARPGRTGQRASGHSITIHDNEITETRDLAQRVAVRIGVNTRGIALKNNRIQGFAKETEEGKR